MKPIKQILPFALWLLRIAVLVFAYSYFYSEVKGLTFNGLHYFIALLFSLFSILLFVGGFLKKPIMTIFSGMILFVLSSYKLFDLFDTNISVDFLMFLIIAGVSLLFVSIGNKK